MVMMDYLPIDFCYLFMKKRNEKIKHGFKGQKMIVLPEENHV